MKKKLINYIKKSKNVIEKIKFKLHINIGQYTDLDYNKAQIQIRASSWAEYKIRKTSCKREPYTVSWLESLKNNAILFDIGANIGAYSLIAASLQKNITVYSFEPHFANFESLIMNIIQNNLGESIIPVNIAVGKQTAIGTFAHWSEYSLGESGSSGHQLNRTKNSMNIDFEPAFMQKIIAMSLDDFCSLYKIVPNAIKIDVDGIELEIIDAGKKTLSDKRVKDVIIEVSDATQNELLKKMKNYGFTLVHIAEHGNHHFQRK